MLLYTPGTPHKPAQQPAHAARRPPRRGSTCTGLSAAAGPDKPPQTSGVERLPHQDCPCVARHLHGTTAFVRHQHCGASCHAGQSRAGNIGTNGLPVQVARCALLAVLLQCINRVYVQLTGGLYMQYSLSAMQRLQCRHAHRQSMHTPWHPGPLGAALRVRGPLQRPDSCRPPCKRAQHPCIAPQHPGLTASPASPCPLPSPAPCPTAMGCPAAGVPWQRVHMLLVLGQTPGCSAARTIRVSNTWCQAWYGTHVHDAGLQNNQR